MLKGCQLTIGVGIGRFEGRFDTGLEFDAADAAVFITVKGGEQTAARFQPVGLKSFAVTFAAHFARGWQADNLVFVRAGFLYVLWLDVLRDGR